MLPPHWFLSKGSRARSQGDRQRTVLGARRTLSRNGGAGVRLRAIDSSVASDAHVPVPAPTLSVPPAHQAPRRYRSSVPASGSAFRPQRITRKVDRFEGRLRDRHADGQCWQKHPAAPARFEDVQRLRIGSDDEPDRADSPINVPLFVGHHRFPVFDSPVPTEGGAFSWARRGRGRSWARRRDPP